MPEKRASREGVLFVGVAGKSSADWEQCREKLVGFVDWLFDNVTQGQGRAWAEKQVADLSSGVLEHAKARLARAGAENEEIRARVEGLYAEREKRLAKARKVHAEAEAQEFENAVRKLEVLLMASKAFVVGEKGKEAVLFGRKLDALLAAIQKKDPPRPDRSIG